MFSFEYQECKYLYRHTIFDICVPKSLKKNARRSVSFVVIEIKKLNDDIWWRSCISFGQSESSRKLNKSERQTYGDSMRTNVNRKKHYIWVFLILIPNSYLQTFTCSLLALIRTCVRSSALPNLTKIQIKRILKTSKSSGARQLSAE